MGIWSTNTPKMTCAMKMYESGNSDFDIYNCLIDEGMTPEQIAQQQAESAEPEPEKWLWGVGPEKGFILDPLTETVQDFVEPVYQPLEEAYDKTLVLGGLALLILLAKR